MVPLRDHLAEWNGEEHFPRYGETATEDHYSRREGAAAHPARPTDTRAIIAHFRRALAETLRRNGRALFDGNLEGLAQRGAYYAR